MELDRRWGLWLLVVVAVAASMARADVTGDGNVTYDERSLIIGGQRKMLFSGSIHYTRSTPQMWPDLIQQAKQGGLDVIQTYVFWNVHEPQPGQYDFNGRHDLIGFLKQVQAQGLYATLRIGPFIEAEWSYGGFPFWLRDIPDIVFRTNNEPFKFYMQNFTTKIVDMMKSEGLYASQGGPIILSQIENEYQNLEADFQEQGRIYTMWAANMVVELDTGVPWVMCKQMDAPDPVINTCNGKKCGETFPGPNSPDKPALWTENWTSFYQMYGEEPDIRTAEDIAFQTLLFIAKLNGSYINYYMYHGGTNFGRTSSAYVTTSYYDQAPLDEYGLQRQPKWGHLQQLHAAVKACSTPFLNGAKTNISLGRLQQAYIFEEQSGDCVAFLNNYSPINATVEFRNTTFELLPESISILQNCQEPIFNSAKVNISGNTRTTSIHQVFDSAESWQQFEEEIPSFVDTSIRSGILLDQMNMTKDVSDYLWYTLSFQANSSCNNGSTIHVESHAHVAYVFINGTYVGSEHGDHSVKAFEMDTPISLDDRQMNNISILSVMVGLPDAGAFLESRVAGLYEVEIRCNQGDTYNFSNYPWGYQVGLIGENLQIYEEQNVDKVAWTDIGTCSENQTLTWYKTVFDAPDDSRLLALNLTTMGKGQVWINGQSIGRYWVSFRTPEGNPSQALYHVPWSFVNPTGNLLVLLEEVGGNPLGVALIAVSTVDSSNNFTHLDLPM